MESHGIYGGPPNPNERRKVLRKQGMEKEEDKGKYLINLNEVNEELNIIILDSFEA